jgi:hypothetical protein
MRALLPCIQSKSRMRKRARTDLCGGRRVIGVPTATKCRDEERADNPPKLAANRSKLLLKAPGNNHHFQTPDYLARFVKFVLVWG